MLLIAYQAQAPKLKADVLGMEINLKQRCDATALGAYTLWATGPEVALEMLQVSSANVLRVRVMPYQMLKLCHASVKSDIS